MALNLPKSASDVVSRSKTDVQRELPSSNPFLPNSWLSALIVAFSYRVYDFYLQLKEAIKQTFFDTSTGENLERQASWFSINRLAATQATGNIVATGTATNTIPNNTLYQSSDGIEYKTTALATLSAQSISVSSITRSGTTATATTATSHNLASNVAVTISGAGEADYNLSSVEITVTALNQFTYQVANSPATPATGTILVAFTSASVSVTSTDFGDDTNQVLDAVLTLQSPISGVDNDASVDFGELGGGTDQETDEALRVRFLDRVQNPVALFNVAAIKAKAKEVNGVTRVFVEEITPNVGQVTVYFMRDNDSTTIPTASEVTTVKNKLLEIKPAHTADVDLIVSAPTAVPVNFLFGSVSPNTDTMKAAINANLAQYFEESTIVGEDVLQAAYWATIWNTVDSTGAPLDAFTLTTPSSDVSIASGEIGTLGTVTIP